MWQRILKKVAEFAATGNGYCYLRLDKHRPVKTELFIQNREVLLAKLAESERNKSGLTFETNNIAEEQDYDNNQKMMWENVSL
jgi:hypothetical protein